MDLEKVKEQQYFNFRKITPESYSTYAIPAYMLAALPEDRSQKILDIGCGFGQMLDALRSLGYKDICGVDISDESIGHCKSLGLKVERIGDLADYMAHHQEEYNFIVMSHVLEHIDKPLIVPYVSLIKSMLKGGGQFLIMVPNAQSNTGCYWMYEDFTHTTLFTAASLYFVLRAGGFEEVSILDPSCTAGLSYAKRKTKLFMLGLFTANKAFWNRITGSSYHKPSPLVYSFEIKALAR